MAILETKRKSISWKEGKVISVRLRDGRYILAQMVKSPYMVFFNLFSEDNSWEGVTLSTDKVLFCHAVTRQWKAHSPIERIKGVEPLSNYELPTRWIHTEGLGHRTREIIIDGVKRSVVILGTRLALVERDMVDNSKNNAPCGLYHTVVKPDLKESDWSRVKDIETMSVEMYPGLNERLYLCSVMGRNVNPELEIYLGRPIPEAYGTYVKTLCGDKIPDYC